MPNSELTLTDVVTPSFLRNLQVILSLGLKPDSFNAESALARSLPDAKRKGGNATLVDVLLKERRNKGIELKCTSSIKSYKRYREGCFDCDGVWVKIPDSALVITRRPNVDCFSDIDPEEGLLNSVSRLREFYEGSKKKESCEEIYSLLVQHNWAENSNSTVFDFSLSKFSIPEMRYAKRGNNTLEGYDEKDEICLLHNAFTRGSQNFSKRYYVYGERLTVMINHASPSEQAVSWSDLSNVRVLP